MNYQLTKEQLVAVLPLLVQHLRSSNYVCYTYAATTIERVLFIKRGSSLLYVSVRELFLALADACGLCRFNQEDIREITPQILDTLLSKIESGGSPEKIAENDYLMKCERLCPAWVGVILTRSNKVPCASSSPHGRLSSRNMTVYFGVSLLFLVQSARIQVTRTSINTSLRAFQPLLGVTAPFFILSSG